MSDFKPVRLHLHIFLTTVIYMTRFCIGYPFVFFIICPCLLGEQPNEALNRFVSTYSHQSTLRNQTLTVVIMYTPIALSQCAKVSVDKSSTRLSIKPTTS